MALVTGGPEFDLDWDDRTNACLLLLREAADRVAKGGAGALPSQAIVDAIFWALATPLPPYPLRAGEVRFQSRFFDSDCAPRPAAHDSCALLRNGSARPRDIEAIRGVVQIIELSTQQWAEGNPEEPDTRSVFRRVMQLLWSSHLARRPPGLDYPHGL